LATQTWRVLSEQICHLPFAIELTHGCSVACDYCCFAAPRLNNVMPFNAENEQLYRSILDVLGDYFGPAAKSGFLYWATEPLDNLDYEKYLRTFFEKFEVTPQTTTAAWYRDMPRTRRLLDQSRRDNGAVNRFSINSLEHFHLCMKQFSAQELIDVELVLQNKEATTIQCAAGRGISANPDAPVGTSACVSGFLINLVERTVKLISPCTDLARWPLGYAIYQECRFEETDEVAGFIEGCDRAVFAATLNDDCVPKLRDDFISNLNETSGELTLSAEYGDLTVSDDLQVEILRSIGNGQSVHQIVRRLMKGHDPAMIYFNFNQLYAAGVFESVPIPDGNAHLEKH
jgi:radical SAM family RiPP maturation amino acid epimerase